MKKSNTRRALLMSALSLLLCISMLIGTTYAWFTDSVTSANNIIKSGNLDIELEYSTDLVNWTNVKGASEIFDKNALWEPGYTEVVYLRLTNLGTLDLKYTLGVNFEDTVVGKSVLGNDIYLSEHLEYGVEENVTAKFADRKAARDAVKDTATALTTYSANGTMTEKGETKTVALVVYMPETVGNEANYRGEKVPQIDLGVNLFATQLASEEDSFDETYDEDAVYGTYVELAAGESLMDALKNAKAGEPLYIKLLADTTYTTEGSHGAKDISPASSIVIDGQDQYAITFVGSGVTPAGDAEAPVTLKDLTVKDESKSYNEGAWELSYLEVGGKNLTCDNVKFADPIMVSGEKATFTDCAFTGYEDTVNGIKMNGVWMYNGDATFTNCTFTGTRGMKICDMYAGGEIGTVVVDNCLFDTLSQKPGVAIDDRDTQDMDITIKNSTFINCQPGDQGLYIYETDNTVPKSENNSVINGAINNVGTAAELLALGGKSLDGLINITADIDLAGAAMPTVGAAYGKELTVLGNGYTISNATTAHTNHNGMKHHGFFYAYTDSTLNISNLKFENITIDATADAERNYGVGIVVCFADGGSNVTLNNVDVKNCVVKNDKPDIGDEAGVYVGYQTGTLVMKDCDSTGCSVAGETGEKTGAFIGMVNGTATLTNCTTDLTIGTCNRVGGTLTEN